MENIKLQAWNFVIKLETFFSFRVTGRPVCEFPGEPKNGYIVPTKFSYNIGDEITIFCKSNDRVHSQIPFMYCNQDGKWSHSLPTCSKYPNDQDQSIEYL